MLFVNYPKCSTCRKAKNWLDENAIEYESRHIVEDNPQADEIKECATQITKEFQKVTTL